MLTQSMPDQYEVLKKVFGYDSFREGQEWLVEQLISNNDAVGIMPTGAGKSICFQVPALLFEGITLVISPLISLMQDQVLALTRSGVPAAYINSSLTQGQLNKAMHYARQGKYKIIYVAPERLLTEDFLDFACHTQIDMVTVDEAHCISRWGQDFRPSYTKIASFVQKLAKRPVVSAFTATATQIVREDICEKLQLQNPQVLITGYDRENLHFDVHMPKDKFQALLAFLSDKKDRSGIIYCLTRKLVEQVSERLIVEGFEATRYHAGLSDAERKKNQEDFVYDQKPVVVATNAFGMGIDKSNVSYVVHYNMPRDLESYYQEAGRAGRDGLPAECVLFFNTQDVNINQFLIQKGKDDVDADADTIAADRAKLRQMVTYCYTKNCYRDYILNYFGDTKNGGCENCGNCSKAFVNTDITLETQKILSCVKRAGERFGMVTISDILRGKNNKRIREARLHTLSTFGIMKKMNDEMLREMIQFLIECNYLMLTDSDYPLLKLGARAKEGLWGKTPVIMKMDPHIQANKKKESTKTTYRQVNQQLFEALKQLRKQLADKEKVPAFVVFSDTTLTDMCMKMPDSEKAFLEVSGVGQVKLQKYGKAFLDVLKPFLNTGMDELIIRKNVDTREEQSKFLDFLPMHAHEIQTSEQPVTISVLTAFINSMILQHYDYNLKTSAILLWLRKNDYIYGDSDQILTTKKGMEEGIFDKTVTAKSGMTYQNRYYSINAQRFIVQNLGHICRLDFENI